MKLRAKMALSAAFLAAAVSSMGNVADNPYSSIVARNPFGLKEPPPPPPPPAENAPTTPPATVTVTGFISLFGQPQVLLEIIDEPGKGGTPKKPILRQGERMGSVEVLDIDVEKHVVRIRNSGMETNITFTVAKATGSAPGVPAVPSPVPGAIPPPTGPGNPTVVSANAGNGGGVTLMGGATAAPSPTIGTGADPNGLRSIPTRPLRGDYNTGNQPAAMTREQADMLHGTMNAINQQRGLPPLPTGGRPDVDGNPQPAPQFPQFPAPAPRPPFLPPR